MTAKGIRTEELLLTIMMLMEEYDLLPSFLPGISVFAWKCYPQEFGLWSFEKEHPDARTVENALCHSLIPRLHVTTDGKTGYASLTKEGRHLARELLGAPAFDGVEERCMPFLQEKVFEEIISKAIQSQAMHDHVQSREVTLNWAMDFWGKQTGQHLTIAVPLFNQAMERMVERLRPRDGIILHNGHHITWKDILAVVALDKSLKTRFCRHLRVMGIEPVFYNPEAKK